MTYKEAREYLQPVADNTPLAGYGEALRKAIEALREMEETEGIKILRKCRHKRLWVMCHEKCEKCGWGGGAKDEETGVCDAGGRCAGGSTESADPAKLAGADPVVHP